MRADTWNGLEAFIAVARHMNFRAAAAEFGVSPSAISQAIRQLESKLGVRLLNRTTRSVQLTEAGRLYLERVRPAFDELMAASHGVGAFSDKPIGNLRLNVPRVAYDALLARDLPDFMARHPSLAIDIDVDDAFVDIVKNGYDAGIRIGEFLEKDMVAVKLGGDLESAIVGSPGYFKRMAPPKKPADLANHNCINFRYYSNRALYRWEFEEDGKDLAVGVKGNLTVNDSNLAVRAALDGIGVAYVLDVQVREHIEAKRLVRVLKKQSPKFPGFYLYYPSRRHAPAKLRAFIKYFQSRHQSRPGAT